ncbi:succinate dehydrogenase, hydrophobic membrane anchor protein [Paracoccus sphaerophysae]|uniref:succinate dehydrogenase, hydrophobic membrane anchor protein n=1 Tax=Paracoccus sphaerophysae TaxID=690417 RepID=UPI00068FD221|nr:succinate dehydrogenase, hydrophobic membrane anchor protein [Paracoccus sphaerophysae]
MRYLTPRKAAKGLGAAGPGSATAQHWSMTVSAVALAILTPAFIFVIASAIGLPRDGVLDYFARPYPAIVTALFLIVGLLHYINGTQIMIDDYLDHAERKVATIAAKLFGWAVIAAAVYALARMAFAPDLPPAILLPADTTIVIH